MAENEPGVEVIPGVKFGFNKIGITSDALNAWVPNFIRADLGKFNELAPVKHYAEYLQDQDRKYKKAEKPGLFQGIMDKSDPEGIVVFDQIVDEFNADLPRIIEQKDDDAVQEFSRRARDLNRPKNI